MIDIADLLVVTIISLLFLGLGWSFMRLVNRGRPLRPIQRQMLICGFLFVLGMAGVMWIGSVLGLPHRIWFMVIAGWGVFLAAVAVIKHRREQRQGHQQT